MSDSQSSGTVKWFNDSKGFGFITQDSSGPDVFAHVNNIACPSKTLREGQKVTFTVSKGQKGLTAENIQPE